MQKISRALAKADVKKNATILPRRVIKKKKHKQTKKTQTHLSMEILKKQLKSKKKEFGRNLLFSILGIFLLYIALFWWLQYQQIHLPQVIPVSFLVLSFIATAFVGYLLTRSTFSFLHLYTIVGVSFTCLIFYLCLLLCHVSSTIFYFYIPILLLVLLLANVKTTVLVGIGIFLISIFTKTIAEFLHISSPARISPEYAEILIYLERLEIFVVAYLSFYLLYYLTEIKNLEFKITAIKENLTGNDSTVNILADSQTDYTKTESPAPISPENQTDEKLLNLYNNILDCMETQKPYRDPNFNIKKLADLLDTNTTYASKALNTFGKKKFNNLINELRIDQVKKDIAENAHQKFTIEHIYTNAGFTQQSTFNRIFKEQTGKTPSEYIGLESFGVESERV